MYDTEPKIQVVLLTVHAFAFVALAAWCLRSLAQGRWAGLGAAGAGLLGLSFGLLAVSSIENVFLDSADIAIELLSRQHVYTVLIAAQAVGALLLGLAFMESRRTPSTTDGSIYGS